MAVDFFVVAMLSQTDFALSKGILGTRRPFAVIIASIYATGLPVS